MAKKTLKRQRGASLIEAGIGIIFIIPLVLGLIDFIAAVVAQTSNDALAKHAARQAASQTTQPLRQQAAQQVVTAYHANLVCAAPQMLSYKEPQANLDFSKQTCVVTTQVVCNLPVAIPFGGPSTQTFQAQATEPLVNIRSVLNGPTGTTSGTGASSVSDSSYLILSSPLPTGLGGQPLPDPAAGILPAAAAGAPQSTSSSSSSSGSSGSSSSSSSSTTSSSSSSSGNNGDGAGSGSASSGDGGGGNSGDGGDGGGGDGDGDGDGG